MSTRDAIRGDLNALDMMPTCVCGDINPIASTICESCGRTLVEKPKRLTHKERVLNLLSDGEPHSHLELYALHVIAHSRVSDLRADGYQISQWRDEDLYWYRLNEGAIPAGEQGNLPPVPGDADLSHAPTSSVTAKSGTPSLSRPLKEAEVLTPVEPSASLSGAGCDDSLPAVVSEGSGAAQLSMDVAA